MPSLLRHTNIRDRGLLEPRGSGPPVQGSDVTFAAEMSIEQTDRTRLKAIIQTSHLELVDVNFFNFYPALDNILLLYAA